MVLIGRVPAGAKLKVDTVGGGSCCLRLEAVRDPSGVMVLGSDKQPTLEPAAVQAKSGLAVFRCRLSAVDAFVRIEEMDPSLKKKAIDLAAQGMKLATWKNQGGGGTQGLSNACFFYWLRDFMWLQMKAPVLVEECHTALQEKLRAESVAELRTAVEMYLTTPLLLAEALGLLVRDKLTT